MMGYALLGAMSLAAGVAFVALMVTVLAPRDDE